MSHLQVALHRLATLDAELAALKKRVAALEETGGDGTGKTGKAAATARVEQQSNAT